MAKKTLLVVALVGLFTCVAAAQSGAKAALKPGAKVFINTMPDAFDTFLKSAMEKKKVPLTIVESKDKADLEITGTSETQKAGVAKKLFMQNWHSDEQATISVSDLKSGEVVFAYSVNKQSSAHGKQSTAEACAKHLKDEVEKKK
jgi:hypothetical protein